jgi:hypothetical protein
VARVELARATLALGDAKSALHILDSLDEAHPCWDRTEASARALVRIEALLVERRFQDALVELEAGAARFDELTKKRLPRLRARALEGAGLAQEASQAWLLVAREESGPARVQAYQTAAGLCADDPLGVLFVAREAKAAGFGAAVADAEHAARESLGVAADRRRSRARRRGARCARPSAGSAAASSSAPARARRALARRALALAPEQRARLVLGRARCLARSSGLEAAVDAARAAERARSTSRESARASTAAWRTVFEETGSSSAPPTPTRGTTELMRFQTAIASVLGTRSSCPVFLGQAQVATLRTRSAAPCARSRCCTGSSSVSQEDPAARSGLVLLATERRAATRRSATQRLEALRGRGQPAADGARRPAEVPVLRPWTARAGRARQRSLADGPRHAASRHHHGHRRLAARAAHRARARATHERAGRAEGATDGARRARARGDAARARSGRRERTRPIRCATASLLSRRALRRGATSCCAARRGAERCTGARACSSASSAWTRPSRPWSARWPRAARASSCAARRPTLEFLRWKRDFLAGLPGKDKAASKTAGGGHP